MDAAKPSLTSNFFKNNRRKLRAVCAGKYPIVIVANGLLQRTRNDDAYPFEQESNFWYLAGLDEPDLILVMEEAGEYLILPARNSGHSVFLEQIDADLLSRKSAVKEVFSHSQGWSKLAETLKNSRTIGSLKPLPTYLTRYDVYTNPAPREMIKKIKRINSRLEVTDLRKMFERLRMVKSELEIGLIKQSIARSGEILDIISRNLNAYKNEHDIAAELNQYFFAGHLKPAFNPIIAGGKNATILHYGSNNSLLAKNQMLLIDFGVKHGNYCSDITRTISIKPGPRQRQVYAAVKETQRYALGLLKPGVLLKDYETKVARLMGEKLAELGLIKTINQKHIRRFYPHGTSHSLGIDVHDPADYGQPLAPGMVLTVEPGIYIKDEQIGVRIEDDVLITETGNEILSGGLTSEVDRLA